MTTATEITDMTVTVWKSDFKDFPGLKSACVFFGRFMIKDTENFMVFKFKDPYQIAEMFKSRDRLYK